MGEAPGSGADLQRIVLASAGAGKTFYLSSRLIELLARDSAPEEILASTFTRKAAGEILDRVLLRLARGAVDREGAAALAASLGVGLSAADPPATEPERWRKILRELLTEVHRLGVGTLDSFFGRVARAFSSELGLMPGWGMADETELERIRARALHELLARDGGAILELVRLIHGGAVTRGIQRSLASEVEGLVRLRRALGPDAGPDRWTLNPDPGGLPAQGEAREEMEELAAALEAAPLPLTRSQTPVKRWGREVARLVEALRQGRWEAFFEKGLGERLVADGGLRSATSITYDRREVPPAMAPLLDRAAELARGRIAADLGERGRALHRIARHFEAAFTAEEARRGVLRFEDIPHLMESAALLDRSGELAFRLDGRIRHILLDEFQDTSLEQWEVLEPLVRGVVVGGRGTAVIVADPKQSIYGWRGAHPDLVDHVRAALPMKEVVLGRSWRSSPVLLQVVDRVFGSLADNPVVEALADGGAAVRGWASEYRPQTAAHDKRPGRVELRVAPPLEGSRRTQPRLLEAAVDQVARIRAQAPRAGIGVLVRDNRSVAYTIALLRRRGLAASGEGGSPLTDSAAVNAILALLELADHPGNRIARYHVARTGLGAVTGYHDPEDGSGARRLAWQVRGSLLDRGYGATLSRWARELAGGPVEGREAARLGQLVELGYQWDDRSTGRPSDFADFVRLTRVDEPSGASVRVMTIHQSKGLEFDAVVLPELHLPLAPAPRHGAAVSLRSAAGRVEKVLPSANRTVRGLFSELQLAGEQAWADGLRDNLSGLYVAMTRARFALYLIVPADAEGLDPARSPSAASLLRAALTDGGALQEGAVAWEEGPDAWYRDVPDPEWSGSPGGDRRAARRAVTLSPPGPGERRHWPRIAPSGTKASRHAADGEAVRRLLRLDAAGDRRLLGTVVHAWCEAIGWWEDGLPDPHELRAMARRAAPGLSGGAIEEILETFGRWLEAEPVIQAFSRGRYGDEVRLEREFPFVHRTPDGLVQGVMDRVVVEAVGGEPVSAEILDFKTDDVDPHGSEGRERLAEYEPQLAAYRAALCDQLGLEPARVRATLVFLAPGALVPVP